MMLRQSLFAAAALTLAAASVNAALVGPGDIAFTGFNADGNDNLAFVALKDIAPSSTFFLTDNEFVTGAFNTGESFSQYTAPATGVAAGTVVTLDTFDSATPTASLGTVAPVTVTGSANRGLSATSDAVYAYLGTDASTPTAFLAYVANDDVVTTTAPLTGTGLTDGTTALVFDGSNDGFQYTGARSGLTSFSAYLPLVNNSANYSFDAADGTTQIPFNAAPFTTVPEPTTLGLLGLGAAGLLRRRRA